MTSWYFDTSAAAKLLVEEAESAALDRAISAAGTVEFVSGYLLETELRRMAMRHPRLTQDHISALLEAFTLTEMPSSTFRVAGALPGPRLRSLDALHLACALENNADALVCYDERLIDSAHALGLSVIAPAD